MVDLDGCEILQLISSGNLTVTVAIENGPVEIVDLCGFTHSKL
jgi:hypothetical protein